MTTVSGILSKSNIFSLLKLDFSKDSAKTLSLGFNTKANNLADINTNKLNSLLSAIRQGEVDTEKLSLRMEGLSDKAKETAYELVQNAEAIRDSDDEWKKAQSSIANYTAEQKKLNLS